MINGQNAPLPAGAALQEVRNTLARALCTAPEPVRRYTAYLSGAQGKLIRARALLGCAADETGLAPAGAVRLAAAVELIHLATLVHDDVIDEADTRRGMMTLQKKYGRHTAVVCGDYLLCAALGMAASTPGREEYAGLSFPDYLGRVCLGELRQEMNRDNLGLSAYSYLKIIGGKTAALFEAAFYAGAALRREDPRRLRRYARLGRYVGMIFQLMDDCADFEASETQAKKPVRWDYEQGVITLPLICALQRDAAFAKKAGEGKLSPGEIEGAVEKNGGLAAAKALCARYYQKAEALLCRLSPPAEKDLRLVLETAGRGFAASAV